MNMIRIKNGTRKRKDVRGRCSRPKSITHPPTPLQASHPPPPWRCRRRCRKHSPKQSPCSPLSLPGPGGPPCCRRYPPTFLLPPAGPSPAITRVSFLHRLASDEPWHAGSPLKRVRSRRPGLGGSSGLGTPAVETSSQAFLHGVLKSQE